MSEQRWEVRSQSTAQCNNSALGVNELRKRAGSCRYVFFVGVLRFGDTRLVSNKEMHLFLLCLGDRVMFRASIKS